MLLRRVIWLPEAEADLDAEYDFIARDDEAQAATHVHSIRTFVDNHTDPRFTLGTARPEFGRNHRTLVFGTRPHTRVLLVETTPTELVIFRVYGRQNV